MEEVVHDSHDGNPALFSKIPRFRLFSIIVAIILLRVVIGFHFFKEGSGKLRAGNFTAEFFLRDAKGPLAPFFQTLLRDDDGRERLCIEEVEAQDNTAGEKRIEFNTDLTFALWDDFRDQASLYYGLGDRELENEIRERRQRLANQIHTAREQKDSSVNTRSLEKQRRIDEQSIVKIRYQLEQSELIKNSHRDQIQLWLEAHRSEIVAHFSSEDRLHGFDRDGVNRAQVATFVESLREQVNSIRADRARRLAEWTSDVEGIWDSLEAQINGLAVDAQKELAPLRLHRPFDQPNSNLKWVDRIVPWFDMIVGALLILGLFTRLAALAGAGFLASIIAMQPPWIPGTAPTYNQTIEMVALIVIFTIGAGRLGGLDYFWNRIPIARRMSSRNLGSRNSTTQTTLPDDQGT